MGLDEAAAPRIFVSYRREDSAPYAGRLFDSLRAHYGSPSVFMDIDSIDPGSDFGEAVHSSLEGCDVIIAVIGREWLSATDRTDRRRLDNPDDWVRLEIEAALQHRIRVIPVLAPTDDGSMTPIN
jgi:TIR domain